MYCKANLTRTVYDFAQGAPDALKLYLNALNGKSLIIIKKVANAAIFASHK